MRNGFSRITHRSKGLTVLKTVKRETRVMEIAYLDGKWMPIGNAKVSVFDRGFMFGDGVYEVVPFYNGFPIALGAHLRRLARSLDSISIDFPQVEKMVPDLLEEGIERSAEKNGLIYIQITRGIQFPRDHNYSNQLKPTFLITISKKGDLGCVKPVLSKVILRNDFRWGRADIKTTSLIANVMLRNDARAAGYDDAILLREGKVTEATAANVFVVKKGVIFTPKKSEFLLHGITRDLVIELCQNHELEIIEGEVTRAFLLDADEIWLSSSGNEIRPVAQIGDKFFGESAWNENSIWTKVYQLYVSEFYAH